MAAGAILVSAAVLTIAFVWSLLAFGQRTHRVLLDHPALGDRRIGVWFAAFVGYALVGVIVVIAILAVASR